MSIVSSSSSATNPPEIVRIIEDPNTGVRWLLLRDPVHPAGPGRLVCSTELQSGEARNRFSGLQQGEPAEPAPFRPVIHIGDRLIVEEHSAVVDASLEAVALNAANLGSSLDVRLRIGGRVLRVLATGPGRASLQPAEVRP
jgi:hypothetical protein